MPPSKRYAALALLLPLLVTLAHPAAAAPSPLSPTDAVRRAHVAVFRPSTGAWLLGGLPDVLRVGGRPQPVREPVRVRQHGAAIRVALRRPLAACPGMIHAGDATVTAFRSVGWGWGCSWTSPKEYQHFSATGR